MIDAHFLLREPERSSVNRIAQWTEPYAALARRVLLWAALATLVAIGLQFVFAGIGVFGASILGIEGFDAHRVLGAVIHALTGLLLAAALVGRLPRRTMGISAALFVVTSVMATLPRAGDADIKAFHPLGALLVFWLTYVVYQHARTAEAVDSEARETAQVTRPGVPGPERPGREESPSRGRTRGPSASSSLPCPKRALSPERRPPTRRSAASIGRGSRRPRASSCSGRRCCSPSGPARARSRFRSWRVRLRRASSPASCGRRASSAASPRRRHAASSPLRRGYVASPRRFHGRRLAQGRRSELWSRACQPTRPPRPGPCVRRWLAQGRRCGLPLRACPPARPPRPGPCVRRWLAQGRRCGLPLRACPAARPPSPPRPRDPPGVRARARRAPRMQGWSAPTPPFAAGSDRRARSRSRACGRRPAP